MGMWPAIDGTGGSPADAPLLGPITAGWPNPSSGPGLAPPDRQAPASDAAPAVTLARHSRPASHGRRRVAVITGAMALSLAAHAAAFVWLRDWRAPEGLETTAEAVSVEVVLEAPMRIAETPVAGEELASAPSAPVSSDALQDAEPPVQSADITPAPERAEELPPVEADNREPEISPEAPTPVAPVQPETSIAEPVTPDPAPTTGEAVPVAPETAEEAAEAEPTEQMAAVAPIETVSPIQEPVQLDADAPLSVVLPEGAAVPLPSPRPEPRVASRPPRETRPAATRPAEPRQAARPPRQAAPTQERTQRSQPAPATRSQPSRAAARGTASAGEQASFARRLLSHVERHKRYPREAQRQRITGSTRLSITIDRSGRLSAARVTKGSGHAMLDSEAMAVARRAAPYPRAPEGVGGSTISFAVTLRFAH